MGLILKSIGGQVNHRCFLVRPAWALSLGFKSQNGEGGLGRQTTRVKLHNGVAQLGMSEENIVLDRKIKY